MWNYGVHAVNSQVPTHNSLSSPHASLAFPAARPPAISAKGKSPAPSRNQELAATSALPVLRLLQNQAGLLVDGAGCTLLSWAEELFLFSSQGPSLSSLPSRLRHSHFSAIPSAIADSPLAAQLPLLSPSKHLLPQTLLSPSLRVRCRTCQRHRASACLSPYRAPPISSQASASAALRVTTQSLPF